MKLYSFLFVANFVVGMLAFSCTYSMVSDVTYEQLAGAARTKKSEELRKLLVPGVDVLLTSVALPKMSSSKLKMAVPFALEENVAENVSQLHFSIGGRKGESYPVAVTNNNKMKLLLLLAKENKSFYFFL